jgi:hypothetical protein
MIEAKIAWFILALLQVLDLIFTVQESRVFDQAKKSLGPGYDEWILIQPLVDRIGLVWALALSKSLWVIGTGFVALFVNDVMVTVAFSFLIIIYGLIIMSKLSRLSGVKNG